ncbi:MAG: prephenate dehydrogenase/arogenate dehydrogenase family protein [Thermoguttaceae bacterium]|jgi:prephenate dehydrogenase|nr:prephenate dehydrogenase/arogenate dehydrogenase family protein [Thermoguttaceae bacterium]
MIKRFNTVAIVGVGLIGGSIGMALRARGLADRVIGVGRRQASLRTARRVGAVTNTTVELAKGVAEADLVVVCTPVGRIVEDVRRAAEHCPEGTLLTDAGSTKQRIVEALDGQLPRGCRFLGSHPLAGSEKAGAANARADLFEGRVALLTPTRNTRAEDFDALEAFWSQLGSVVIQMSPADHDRALALTSHLPHLIAAALAGVQSECYFRLAGAGLLDTTRIAAGDPELWRQIFVQNRQNVLAALDQFEAQLSAFRAAIRDGNEDALEELLAIAKKNRDALGS